MQAHLRQKQQQVMEAHAAREAAKFVERLTASEKDALRERFLRLDAAGTPLTPPPGASLGASLDPSGEVTPDQMKQALWELSESLAQQERAKKGTGAGR
jgi:hypothetical protein